jgi:hypothetical protein
VIDIQDGEFIRVRIPALLERSLHLALGGVHAPFFTLHEGDAVVVILRREEWNHLAPRFVSGQPTAGFRPVSIHPPHLDGHFPARLNAALAAAGVAARLLPSFHNDHLLVAGGELDRTLEAIRRLLSEERLGETGPEAR